jgi:hypothetical protein
MRKLAGLVAFVALLGFGTVATVGYASDPMPPKEEKYKPKPGAPKLFAGDEKKDEKKDDKGGK